MEIIFEIRTKNTSEKKETLRDLCVTVSSDRHIKNMCQSAKNICGWILRTFFCLPHGQVLSCWSAMVSPQKRKTGAENPASALQAVMRFCRQSRLLAKIFCHVFSQAEKSLNMLLCRQTSYHILIFPYIEFLLIIRQTHDLLYIIINI